MITASELFVMANISCTDEILTERLSNLCDALELGFIAANSDQDAILSLAITPAGKAMMLPPLPTATA
jgi:hypothetical protein